MLVFKFLERLIQLLNVPLTITGVLAFFGYNLNIQSVRAALDTTFPDHFAIAFGRLTWLDYLWSAGYVALVGFYWYAGRYDPPINRMKIRPDSSLLAIFSPFLLLVGGLVVIGAFTLTLCYLVGDLLSPACVVVASDERCIDKLGFGMILIWVGCGSFTLLSTLGAAYLGDLQRKGWPSDSEASPDS